MSIDCKWAGSDRPRFLPGRHDDHCADEHCRGCQACPERHCRVCGKDHVTVDGRGDDQTCAACIGETRETIDEIARMCAGLPEEVEIRGVDHEAMVLLGPVADPEARGHLEASVTAGRVSSDYLEKADGERHPLFVLGSWEMVLRDAFDQPEATERITVADAAGYLERNLVRAANDPHVDFDVIARDLRACRAHLERVLHDGEQIERGAPCWHCNAPMERKWASQVADDHWVCPRASCKFEVTDAQYRGWVQQDALDNATRLTATELEQRLGVKATKVRVWGARGVIRKVGKNPNGLTQYDVAEVEARHADDQEARPA